MQLFFILHSHFPLNLISNQIFFKWKCNAKQTNNQNRSDRPFFHKYHTEMFRFPYQSLCLSIRAHVWVCSPSGLSPGLSPWLTSFPALISMVRRRVSSWPALGRSSQNFTGCARETRGIANKTPAAKSASSCATPSSESTRFHLAITSSPHGEASPMELSHDVDTCLSIHQWVINRSHRQGSQLKKRTGERSRGVAVSTKDIVRPAVGACQTGSFILPSRRGTLEWCKVLMFEKWRKERLFRSWIIYD